MVRNRSGVWRFHYRLRTFRPELDPTMIQGLSAGTAALAALSLSFFAPPTPSTATVATAAGIQWEDTYEGALERAKLEGRVIFLAVNMDGEAANDRMAERVYRDKRLVSLTEHTVNLIASADRHSKKGKCPRFGCSSCDVHRTVDIAVRKHVLEPDETGAVIAPQHVFMGPDGEVLLSVPYEVSLAELEWCFGEAFERAGQVDPPKISGKARRPRRLILGGVSNVGGNQLAPLTREDVIQLIAELRKGGAREDLRTKLRQLATSDEPEAREYVLSMLRSNGTAGGRGGGGGRRGGGGGGGGNGRGGEDERAELLRWIGTASPPSYVEIVLPFVGTGIESTRAEAIVALEQLASEEATKELLNALKKAKEPAIEKNLLRAIGSSGADDRKARARLLKASNDVKNPLARQNALIALGWSADDEDVDERLRQGALPEEFGKKAKIGPDRITELEREAAVVAMGLSRRSEWTELLEGIQSDADEPQELRDAAAASLKVIAGEDLAQLRVALQRAGTDTIPRDRLFPGQESRGRRSR